MVHSKGVQPVQGGGLQLAALNHISVVCRSLQSSVHFYSDVLGFIQIRRPDSFDFDGAWLFNYGIGIHLLQAEDPESMPPKKTEIDPKDNHISFQCESIEAVQRRLKELGVRYVQRRVEEGGIFVDQLFFHDPDGFMVEVCTCDNLPVVPLVHVEGNAILGLPPPAPACKRPAAFKLPQSQPLPSPTAVLSPRPAAAPHQFVPAKASSGACVGEVEPSIPACATTVRSRPEHACMLV